MLKASWTLPVLKPGKYTSQFASLLPMSLISCAAKLLERLIQRRVAWFLERQILPDAITGFRKPLSAQDSILYLTSDIERNRNDGNNSIAVFMEIKIAFDGVDASRTLIALQDMGVHRWPMGFLGAYSRGRTFTVKLGAPGSSSQVGPRAAFYVSCCPVSPCPTSIPFLALAAPFL